ncbi:MAG: hydroxyacylglutathione hydrolase C-terminal domain-containing protein, partial [Gallionella sp.]
PFLRCNQPEIIKTLKARGMVDTGELAVFSALREWRSQF